VAHVFERAPSGRAKCRGCGRSIAKDELRFGERLPNPYAEGEMTLWFHVPCGAYRRPEAWLEALETAGEPVPDAERLAAEARHGRDHRRLPRLDGAGRAPTGRARCRSCREPIEKGTWRSPLVFYEDGRFSPSGFVHLRCFRNYFETTDVLSRIRHFSPELSEADIEEIRADLDAATG
jgi:hypothetical protein